MTRLFENKWWQKLLTVAETGRATYVVIDHRRKYQGKRLRPHDSVRGFYKRLGYVETGR